MIETLGNGTRTIEWEASELSNALGGKFTRYDFIELENDNIGVEFNISTTGPYQIFWKDNTIVRFTVLIEYVYSYPDYPPRAWIVEPKIEPTESPHMYREGDICYVKADEDWNSVYTSYEASAWIKSWIYAFCVWVSTGKWYWTEGKHT